MTMAITKPGESQKFTYSGKVVSFTVPFDGLYGFEVIGGYGGTTSNKLTNTPLHNWGNGGVAGGRSGKSIGYKVLKAGDVLYICVGHHRDQAVQSGGYNGGSAGSGTYGCGGGGATHIATTTNRGELRNYNGFRDEILIVAGGGGGSGGFYHANKNDSGQNHRWGYGGGGGGLTSEAGRTYWPTSGKQVIGSASDQNTGYAFGVGQPGWASDTNGGQGGGGGGWYGGKNDVGEWWCGGGGGSSYIGGVPEISFNGALYTPKSYVTDRYVGSATITFLKTKRVFGYIGEKAITKICYGTKEITCVKSNTKYIE